MGTVQNVRCFLACDIISFGLSECVLWPSLWNTEQYQCGISLWNYAYMGTFQNVRCFLACDIISFGLSECVLWPSLWNTEPVCIMHGYIGSLHRVALYKNITLYASHSMLASTQIISFMIKSAQIVTNYKC